MFEIVLVLCVLFPLLSRVLVRERTQFYLTPVSYFGFVLSILLLLQVAVSGEAIIVTLFEVGEAASGGSLARFGLALDPLSAILICLVQFISAVVFQYSVRYLRDDPKQTRFFTGLSLTVTCVLLLLTSSNLLMFVISWIGSSYFLHGLLTHFNERKGAVFAATQKFWVSRLGDFFLVCAVTLLFIVFGTFNFDAIFKLASNGVEWRLEPLLDIASACLVLGAMIKSAQFPFHYWLPNSLETPTPVSALMHAGIINAGGYLVIRMSPILVQSSSALLFLALIGTITAAYGSIVMITQTDVKRSLAYSTLAQMGFMMLQCGLGAFAIASLHIVGHAIYKAYAFLSSGGAAEAALLNRAFPQKAQDEPLWMQFGALVLALTVFLVGATAIGVDLQNKPGALVLTFILGLAMAQTLLSSPSRWFAGGAACLIGGSYLVLYKVFATFLAPSVAHLDLSTNGLYLIITSISVTVFLFLFWLQNNLKWISQSKLGTKLYVSAYNGNYWGRI